MAGKAETTSCSMRLKVAPTWSARPACAGTPDARVMKRASAAAITRTRRPRPVPPEAARAGCGGLLEHRGRLMGTEDLAQGIGDLAERHTRANRVQDEGDQVVAALGRALYGFARASGSGVPRLTDPAETLGKHPARGGVALEEVRGRLLVQRELVDAYHDAGLGLDLLLVAVGRFLDLPLHERDGAHRAAESVDLGDVTLRLVFDPLRERLHGVRAPQRIRRVGHA